MAALLASGLGARQRRSAEALLVVTRFKVVKIRLQQQWGCLGPRPGHAAEVPGPVHCARAVVREEGLRGMWASVLPTVLSNCTNQAAMFTCKSRLDAALWGKRRGQQGAPRLLVDGVRVPRHRHWAALDRAIQHRQGQAHGAQRRQWRRQSEDDRDRGCGGSAGQKRRWLRRWWPCYASDGAT
ncbi:mitochondrial succinate-fumarate transporter 1 [Panicum miliaceum]|uniref:Mitochondrial succinate-fumarate transporter 1 n=1 Tax=Panicum miliaceum TaxID=4540 RepID=A0A3L6R2G9_PANMI|nr:mitochondrial succinate-fumarate transporter 1 [Panicum miliaceum]